MGARGGLGRRGGVRGQGSGLRLGLGVGGRSTGWALGARDDIRGWGRNCVAEEVLARKVPPISTYLYFVIRAAVAYTSIYQMPW